MDEFEEAKAVYSVGKELIAFAREDGSANSKIEWLVDDLDDALLDLKEAVMTRNLAWTKIYARECKTLIADLDNML